MQNLVFGAVGFILGGLCAWLWGRSQAAVLSARMGSQFKDLASDALASNTRAFLDLARENLGKYQERAHGDLESRKQAIEELVKPLQENLLRFQDRVSEIESARQEAYGALRAQLAGLASTQEKLEQETGNLVTALRRPEVRGQWGEVQLRNVAELAGMSPYCDFTEQESFQTEEGRRRPDMLVRLPNGRQVVVDSKVSLDAYLSALEAPGEEQRRALLRKHAQQVRKHMEQLAAKSYWEQFASAPEFVVLFLRSESLFSAALEHDRKLIEDGMARKVIIATPTTLIALLKAVAYGWRQEKLTDNARNISELGKELYERIAVLAGHLSEFRKHLAAQVSSFNAAVGSLENRVLPSARKFRELGVASEKTVETMEPVDEAPRSLPQGP